MHRTYYCNSDEEMFYAPKTNYDEERVNQNANHGYRNTQYQKGLTVSKENYFTGTHSQYLHYFIPNTNKLKLLHLDQLGENSKFRTIKLAMNGQIPSFYKSIISPSGEIFLIGGVDTKTNQKRSGIYTFNSERNSLEFVNDMITPRSSHAVCYMNGNIFIVGGFKQSASSTTIKQCEVFNIANRTCRPIGSLLNSCANCSISAFNNEYVFKFGGIVDNGDPSKYMEVYIYYYLDILLGITVGQQQTLSSILGKNTPKDFGSTVSVQHYRSTQTRYSFLEGTTTMMITSHPQRCLTLSMVNFG